MAKSGPSQTETADSLSGHLITIVAGVIAGILLAAGVIFYAANEHERWMPPRSALFGLLEVFFGLCFIGQAVWNRVLARKITLKHDGKVNLPLLLKWQTPTAFGVLLIIFGLVQFLWLWRS